MALAKLIGGAVAAILAALPAAAQQDPEIEALILRSEIPGLPDRAIDLGAQATRRYAVVIGNADYAAAPDLKNAAADARLVGDFLRARGYEVIERSDLDKRGFEALLRQVLFEVDRDTEVVFYYAGHGVQIGPKNFLIPTDAHMDGAYDVPFEAVALDSVIRILGARARLQMIILDSCRDNPFENASAFVSLRGDPQAARPGFSTQRAPVNTLLAFSTSPGAVAFDGDGANSPFTAALIEAAAAAPDAPVSAILESVRKTVYRRTGGRQVSWDSSTLVEPIFFDAASRPALPAPTGADAEAATRSIRFMPYAETAPAGAAEGDGVMLKARLDREVEIGSALFASFAPTDGGLEIVESPTHGRLAQPMAQGPRRPAPTGAPLQPGPLVYVAAAAAGDGAADGMARDRFSVSVGGERRAVLLEMEADPCDREAGDHLDPGGVGAGRYPNEITVDAAVAACEAAVARSPEVGRFHYQLGRAYLASLRYNDARAEFERARDLGHVRAWHALGALIASEAARTGGRSDDIPAPKEALAYYALGVERGDPYAFHALGKQLLRHGETAGMREMGFELLSRALEVGHTFSMNELGAFFAEEGTDHNDPDRGLRYWRESAARNDIYGYNNMGWAYQSGLGALEPNAAEAAQWYRRAAEGGHPEAPSNLARLYNAGALGAGPDFPAAVRWYDLGLARGDGWGGANAAWIIANRRPAGFDRADAAVRAAKATQLRNAEAAAAAGEVLAGLDRGALDGGAQKLIAELGEGVAVDGAFGPASEAAMARVFAAHGETAPSGLGPLARLEALAALYWRSQALRVDLH